MDNSQRRWTLEQKRVFWREHIEAWKLGTQSQKAYCAEQKLAGRMFQKWRARFKREDEIVELRARSKRKKTAVLMASEQKNSQLLAERVRVLRARIAMQNPVAAQGKDECGVLGESRITSAR